MARDTNNPYHQFRFRVEIDGIPRAGFHVVTFSDAATDLAGYHEGNASPAFRKLFGITKYRNITLRQGIMDSRDFFAWCKNALDSGSVITKKDLLIALTDETGADTVRWEIVQAWPVTCSPPAFNADGSEVAIDKLEIACEGFTQVR